uniref:Uncharacterized protein n=1 Tax=Physcomitrium patens TaxID=3218 RepID=A0A2K1JZ81_PHYPA|nr:hypothetical protein PHYPA_013954 [Physcomitrium patens]
MYRRRNKQGVETGGAELLQERNESLSIFYTSLGLRNHTLTISSLLAIFAFSSFFTFAHSTRDFALGVVR